MYSADDWKDEVARALSMDYTGVSSPVAAGNAIRTALAVARLSSTRSLVLIECRRYVGHPRFEKFRQFSRVVALTALPPLGTYITVGEFEYHLRTLSWLNGHWVSAEKVVMPEAADFLEEISDMVRIGWKEVSE